MPRPEAAAAPGVTSSTVGGSKTKGVCMVGALILGLVAGFLARALVPNDAFENLSGPKSWLVSIVLGLVGGFVGYLIFNRLFGIGDDDMFDLGG
ncbi:MAG TPA: hypothetical protein VF178_16755, partial [Gemmatimonadaceae bacterium]